MRSDWAGLTANVFWSITILLLAVGGCFVWRMLATAPERARQDECRRTCMLVEMEYLGVTEYGCVCRGDFREGGPVLLRRDVRD